MLSGSRSPSGTLPVPVVGQAGGVGGVEMDWVLPGRSPGTTSTYAVQVFAGSAASPCAVVLGPSPGLSAPSPWGLFPAPYAGGTLRPTLYLQFLMSLSKQPGKVGSPVPMRLMGTWKPRYEPVEASRIQTTSV